ncbi:hypothetical protein VP01_9134g1, partial [Puccinia sorghi]
ESESSLKRRKSLSSTPENESMLPEQFEEENSDPYFLHDFPDDYAHLSERAKKTLKNTNHHSQSFYSKSNPFLITLSKRIKSTPFSIDIRTFSSSNDLIVTKDKTVLFLVSFHPLSQKDSTFNCLAELIEDLYIMSNHHSNLKNKNKISGRISGIGFRGDMKKAKQLVRDVLVSFISLFLTVFLFIRNIFHPKNLKSSQLALEMALQKKLPEHNKFISYHIQNFSHDAHENNRKSLDEFKGIYSFEFDY